MHHTLHTGMGGVYWWYSFTTALVCLLVWYSLPETRNKSLTEITNMFKEKEAGGEEEKKVEKLKPAVMLEEP